MDTHSTCPLNTWIFVKYGGCSEIDQTVSIGIVNAAAIDEAYRDFVVLSFSLNLRVH